MMTPATALYEQAKMDAYTQTAAREFMDYIEHLKHGSITFHFTDGTLQKVECKEFKKPRLTNLDITD